MKRFTPPPVAANLSKLLIGCCLALCGAAANAQGLQGVIVEEYTTVTAADAAFYNGLGGGTYTMSAGMKCYRVYVDMAPNYLLNSVLGSASNPLDITSSTPFFNDDNVGSQFPGETRRLDEGLAFDSWITVGRASKASAGAPGCTGVLEQLGVPRTADTNGNLTMCNNYTGFGPADNDGHVPGTSLDVSTVGILPADLTAFTANGSSFTTTGSWALLPAQPGPELAGANRMLIGQFTTSGTFTFHINLSLKAPGGALELYTHTAAESGSTVSPYLTYPQPVTGCSSSQSVYLKPIGAGNTTTSLLTVGDAIGGYPMAGLPDGLGAFDNGNGTLTLLMNHEMANNVGAVHAHGAIGAFVSKWVLDKSTLCVQSGADLITTVKLWNGSAFVNTPGTAFTRFCAGDLPEASAFYNAGTGKGTTERIYLNGEESGNEGRAFGHIVTGPNAGTTYQLPYLGRFSWENAIANPTASDKTIVAGTDDTTPGQVYIYIGTKKSTGTEIDKAGLNNGNLYGVAVTGLSTEVSGSVPAPGAAFTLANLGNVANLTGATLNTNSNTAGVTTFLRPEDGAWDPSNPSDFYFVTTNAFTSPSRLWKLHFTDILNPELGGTITAVLDGTEPAGQKMMDNMVIDQYGQAWIQEDPGNQAYIGRMHKYDIATDVLTPVAYHDSARFLIGGANYLTQDEEASGIIDMKNILGKGRFLFVDQAHYATTPTLVEGGQLLELATGDTINPCVPATIASISGAQTICTQDTLALSSSAAGTLPISYSWSGTGTYLFGGSNPSALVTGVASGTYSVTVTNACGSATGNVSVTVPTVDDGDACTTDACAGGVVSHTPVSTDDGDACTTDGCDPVTGVFHNAVNTDDGNACTTDGCDPVTGVFHNAVNTDDGDACTTDGCDPVTGVFHNPVSTDDGDACTTDGCDPVTGVFHTPVSTDDGNACTTDGCDPVTGVFHNAVNTDDSNVCTTDGCDPVTGVFHNAVNTDDGSACTDDGCDPVTGVFHNAVNCDDGDPCTTDGCDPVTGCYHNGPISCDDGNACTTDSYNCATSQCEHTPVSTDDGNACTTDGCDPVTGVFHNAVNTDDSNACTTDGCDPVTGVFHTPVSTDDSNACTTDGCDPVTGVFHNAVNTDDSNVCTTDGCDPVTGVFHTPVSTDDGNPCTTDSCDPITGIQHSNVADGTSCGVGFQCLGGICTPIAGCANNNVNLELQTDANGAQTNWDIVLISTNTVQCSGGISPTYPNNTLITANCCLPDGCYELRVKDTFGDGMTTGGYRLKDQFGNRIIDNWGDGVFGSLSQIALNTGFCLDLSTDQLTAATCDQMNLSTSSVLQAVERTAVTAQFGITNSTSGYQFLIFNPDGGYVRYVFQNMTQGAGTGAQKSRSLLISSLMTSPVPQLQLLNVRVRSRVAGVYAQFGPACRMKIDPTVPCATTQLDNNPANIGTTYSCGVTGKMVGGPGYTGKLYALPVAGATQYRFRLVSGAYTRNIAVTSNVLNLGAWATLPLLCATHTYNVDIAISKNNGASYCPYGPVCTVSITNPGGSIPCTTPVGGGSLNVEMTEETGMLAMWPNPNRGDQLYLQMTGISADVTEVSVDVHDLFGKRVISEIVTTGGGDLNHVLELGSELASGVYTVTVMAGDQIKTQRLVVE